MTSETKKVGRVRAAILDWLGVPIGLATGGFWSEVYPESAAGKSVTVDRAMQLSAAWACVRLLSETISTLPIKMFERRADGTRIPATQHPLYKVICKHPNREMTPARLMLMIVASLCLWGNAYVELKLVGSRIVALVPLLPQRMKVKRSKDTGRLVYTYWEDGKEREIAEDSIMHIRGFGLDGVCGTFAVASGRDVFGGALAADEAAYKMFAQGMQASGLISSDGYM